MYDSTTFLSVFFLPIWVWDFGDIFCERWLLFASYIGPAWFIVGREINEEINYFNPLLIV